MKVIKVSLGFENCECIDIPGEFINGLYVDDLTKVLRMDASSKNLEQSYRCGYCRISLTADAAVLKPVWEVSTETLIERIKMNDLAIIDIVTEDGAISCYVPWYEGDEYINRYMKVSREEANGNIIIQVEKKG